MKRQKGIHFGKPCRLGRLDRWFKLAHRRASKVAKRARREARRSIA